MNDLEFYPTPSAFTHWLFNVMASRQTPIAGTVLEACVGDGAIIRAAEHPARIDGGARHWITNDLDPRWAADFHLDAKDPSLYRDIGPYDWSVGNPPFTPALEIIEAQLRTARVGVAMHLRASIHEVLKTGIRRTWFAEHEPTGILWLPRFAYQRSKTTGKWTTDSVCACWVIWLKDPRASQFINYAPTSVLDALQRETPIYRAHMDRLMAEYRRTA